MMLCDSQVSVFVKQQGMEVHFTLAFTCFVTTADEDSSCKLPSGEAGIIWDSICFAFLLLQRRVFMSYYFLHVVADIKTSQILASRWVRLWTLVGFLRKLAQCFLSKLAWRTCKKFRNPFQEISPRRKHQAFKIYLFIYLNFFKFNFFIIHMCI
jgi:hypothetical protein